MDRNRPRSRWMLLAVSVSLLAACASQPDYKAPSRSVEPRAAVNPDPGQRIAALAFDQVGTAYRYGGANPAQGFDCSGLVFYTFTQLGVEVPRTSQAQFKAAKKINLGDADRGDLVFFQDQQKLSHVGIYLGSGRFVHAPATGRKVSVADLTEPYYQRHLVAVGRLLPD